uniref:Uncharacterized protein n=1 Tax=Arion vulgaris TaxID=1028688 RepID=A0A0B7AC59_9EUPU
MAAIIDLSFSCIVVFLIMFTTVLYSSVDGAIANTDTVDSTGAILASTTSADQEVASEADIIQFLKKVNKKNNQVASNNRLHGATDSILPRKSTQPSDASVESVDTESTVIISLVIGISAAGLLVVLAVIVVSIYVCCKSGKRGHKDMSLNKDFNRWDPQLLRPTKSSIDAFIFGSPIPSVAEMIKQ